MTDLMDGHIAHALRIRTRYMTADEVAALKEEITQYLKGIEGNKIKEKEKYKQK